MAASDNALKAYRAKRDFKKTPEPSRGGTHTHKALTFVVQKHAARTLHYDFRLELQGTLKSWAVPKGPSLDPLVKRMGVHVEDHPLSYAGFEGVIPPKQYGAGQVIVWDRGLWTPLGDPVAGLKSGKLKFELHGEKLTGGWTLVRMHGRGDENHEPWLLIKEQDDKARAEKDFKVTEAMPNSVLTGQGLPEHAAVISAPAPGTRGPANTTQTDAANHKNDGKTRVSRRGKVGATMPEGATKAALPPTLSPQLATLVDSAPPNADDWAYEIKFDGYRLLVRIESGKVQCFTRNGHDWTAKLPKLAKALAQLDQLGLQSGWLDGEIVVMNAQGLPDFGALQSAFDSASTASIVYYMFDLPFLNGFDLRQVPHCQRRELLRKTLAGLQQPTLRFSQTFDESAQALMESAKKLGLEGVIGKRRDGHYASRRSSDWIKLKTQLRQEFVIGGYTRPKGSRTGLGALLLGVHDASGKLQYAGHVGTGFNQKTLTDITARLSKLHSTLNPFSKPLPSVRGQWVKPTLLAEVAFSAWTHNAHIRHAVFQGLRNDKRARNIVRESPQASASRLKDPPMPKPPTADVAARKPTSKSRAKALEASAALSQSLSTSNAALKSIRITHGERVIDKSSGFTKQNLVDYYALVAELMLPHLKSRPTSLVRAPAGIEGQLFFQKHAEAASIPGIRRLDPKLDPGHDPLLEIPSAAVLLAATQVNVVEFHTWNATTRSIHKPDRMTFDLDPGDGVGWPEIQEAAQLVRAFLHELGLVSFLKTSGGKGLHVVVPLKRAYDFETVKDFSQAIVAHLARVIPQRFVARSGPKNRVGKIFIDYLRNGFGATTVCAWSVRARPGMGVSVPVAWDELASLTGGAHWTAGSLGARLATGNKPWSAYQASSNALSAAMKQLGFERPASPGTPTRRETKAQG